MTNQTKKIMDVSCFINDEKLCNLKWDEMPNVGMSFDYKKREYMILGIKDSKITVKLLPKRGVKK